MPLDSDVRELLQMALAALRMSSPNLDSLYRWQDASWAQQRSEALRAIATALQVDEKRGSRQAET